MINVRGAESIRKQGTEGKTRTTLDDPSEILVHRPDGSIKAYQKGFTKEELKNWCQQELGDGYTVENATRNNGEVVFALVCKIIYRERWQEALFLQIRHNKARWP